MGVLVQAKKRYIEMCKKNNYLTPDDINLWFGEKVATQRDLETMSFTKKSAVVLIGVSCIGKTAFMKKFVSKHPEFKEISYDDCSQQATFQLKKYDEDTSDEHMLINVEKLLRKHKNDNIIIDGLLVNVIVRAPLFEVLRKVYGYEIHVVYFTSQYAEKILPRCALVRSVREYLFDDYIKGLSEAEKKGDLRKIFQVRDVIVEQAAKEEGVSVIEYCFTLRNNPIILKNMKVIGDNFFIEIEDAGVQSQEMYEIFKCGADYYYEFKDCFNNL